MQALREKTGTTNVNETERWVSLVSGGTLIAYGFARRDRAGVGLAALGGYLTLRGQTGYCALYDTLSFNSARQHGGEHIKGTGVDAGVPYRTGVRVDHEIYINRSPGDLYRFWRRLENLPRFMQHLDSVKETSDNNSHWVAKGPGGWKIEWDAEIVNDEPNHLIGWRTLPGSDIDMGGSVRFTSAAEGAATDLKVSLQYRPPAGPIGKWISKLSGEDPARTVREDLHHFKELMETGTVTLSGAKKGSLAFGKKSHEWDRDTVTNSSEESFPASDPPSWTPERA